MTKGKTVNQVISLSTNTFRHELQNPRVIMGYVLSVAILAYWLNNFFNYVSDTGEPVNILEAFVVIQHYYVNMLFLVLGWLMVIADAPFVKDNTLLILYRSSRRKWSMGMVSYILIQALFYVLLMALVTIIPSLLCGYWGEIWSSPLYNMGTDIQQNISSKYQISFSWYSVMQYMTVPQAFGISFLSMYLYISFLGILLYASNLVLNGVFGIIIVVGVHLIGYNLMKDNVMSYSLLARSIPGNFIDGTNRYWESPCIFLILIAILILLSLFLVRKVDFKGSAEGDG